MTDICTIIYITILTLARLGHLCFEKLRFFKMCSQNAVNAISETQILKISWGAYPQTP
jgi:putative component of membrane protein insertase Oxa1/YidC/SpoIIIJ protein YidD